MSLSKQLLKNIFATWFSFAVRVAITFFFTPFITSSLGQTRYGAWVIVFATIDYLSMVDFGMKQSLVRYISKFLGENRTDRVNETLNTAIVIYAALGAIVFGASLIVIHFLGHIVDFTSPEVLAETKETLFVVSLQVSIFFWLMPFASTLGAFHRYDLSNAVGIVEELLRVGALVLLLQNGCGLPSLAWAMLILSVLRQIVSIIMLRRVHPELRFAPRLATKNMGSTLLSYSKISFFITIMWLVIFRADPYILGGALSVIAAGVYAPATQLFHYLRNLINAIGTPLVPAISHLESQADMGKLAIIYLKGVRYITFLSSLFAIGCIFYAQDFVRLWLSPEFREAGEVMIVLAIPAAIYLPQIVGNSILFGTERHRDLLRVLLIEAVAKVSIGLFLVHKMGLLGLAFGTGIPQFIIYGFVFPVVMHRAVGVSVGRFYVTFLRSALIAAAVGAPISLLMRYVAPPIAWPQFVLNVLAVMLCALPAGYMLVEKDDRARIRGLLKRA